MLNRMLLLVFVAGSFWGCAEEPEGTVTGTTADGAFELTLKAEPNWVRLDASLIIELSVRRLDPTVRVNSERVEFVVNNGSISPNNVSVIFSNTGTDADHLFQEWITFKSGRTDTVGQADIHAFFRGMHTTFKTRIVPAQSQRAN